MKTKTNCIILGLIIFSGFNIKAQELKFGLLAGFDVSNVRLTNMPDIKSYYSVFDPMISFNANGYVGYKSARFWGISIEPGFIQKGGVTNSIDKTRFQLNYLQMPVLFDCYIWDKLFISIGPEFSYMVNARSKSKDNSNDISDSYDKKIEVSGLIGINYGIFDKIDIGLRYNHGLTYTSKTIWTNELGNTQGESKEYNQYIQLILRFKI